jgi:hypothetical protein
VTEDFTEPQRVMIVFDGGSVTHLAIMYGQAEISLVMLSG